MDRSRECVVSPVKEEISIKDIAVEWKSGKVRGFRSIDEAKRYIKHVCRKAAPNLKYSIYKYM